jgi:prepilin-type N-terminal cleavage/methylation domain-containing protein
MRHRGFTLVEILVVLALVLFGLFALLSVYVANVRHATQSRARILGSVIAQNLLAEIRDHQYGTPPPANWGDPDPTSLAPATETCRVFVQGRSVQTSFQKRVSIAPDGNGSFFDPRQRHASDKLLVTIRWVEGEDNQRASEEKNIAFTLLVRREPNLVVPLP